MNYNSGNARRIFHSHWNKLREEYRAVGMSEDAIEKMYEYDLAIFNEERKHHRYDVEIPASDDIENQSDLVAYEKATTVTDTYHETKTRFAWVGEIMDERLHYGLERLSSDELELLTLYIVGGYTEKEISKVYNVSQPAIHKKIRKIALFLKKF